MESRQAGEEKEELQTPPTTSSTTPGALWHPILSFTETAKST